MYTHTHTHTHWCRIWQPLTNKFQHWFSRKPNYSGREEGEGRKKRERRTRKENKGKDKDWILQRGTFWVDRIYISDNLSHIEIVLIIKLSDWVEIVESEVHVSREKTGWPHTFCFLFFVFFKVVLFQKTRFKTKTHMWHTNFCRLWFPRKFEKVCLYKKKKKKREREKNWSECLFSPLNTPFFGNLNSLPLMSAFDSRLSSREQFLSLPDSC